MSTIPTTFEMNKNAPSGSTEKIVIIKANPVFWSGETVVIAYDKDNKEIHYNEQHEDIGIIGPGLAALAGFMIGTL